MVVGGGRAAGSGVPPASGGGIREAVYCADATSDPVAETAGTAMPFSRRRQGMHDPSRQADAVPAVPVLAGTGREPGGLEGYRGLLSGNRQGTADSDWNSDGDGERDAEGVSGTVWFLIGTKSWRPPTTRRFP